jgi:hypothetical protein
MAGGEYTPRPQLLLDRRTGPSAAAMRDTFDVIQARYGI